MMAICLIVILLGCVGLLSSCAPDPRNQADADATRARAEQDALDQQQARSQREQQFNLQQSEAEQEAAQRVKAYLLFVAWVTPFMIFFACISLVGVGIGTSWGAIGLGRAVANAAIVRSNLIHMDVKTRTFPALYYEGKGIFTVANLSTGEVMRLDTAKPADRQMIASMGAVQLAGIVAYEARQHKTDPTGVAMVGTSPVVISAHDEANGTVLDVGDMTRSIFRQNAEVGDDNTL
jgi:hypothetical protein